MRHFVGLVLLLMGFGAVTTAADPTPQDAIAVLARLKAKVQPANGTEPDKIVAIDFARRPITVYDLKVIGLLKNVQTLNMGGVYLKAVGGKNPYAPKQIGDDGLKAIAGMTELTVLELDGTHVTDAGLKHLAGMKKLKTLVLSGTKVTDDGMEELTKLPKLESVNLYDTKITDGGVTTLKRWKLELAVNR